MKEQQHILLKKLDEFVRKYYKNKLVKGLIYTFTIVFLFFISLVVLEYFGNFGSKARTGLFFAFLGVALVTFVNYITIPLVRLFKLGKFIDYETAAQIIGTHFESVKDKLLNTLQLIKNNENTDSDLVEAGINQKINELKPVPFAKAIDLSKNKKYLKYAAIPLFLFFVILFMNASIIKDGTKRFVNYRQEFAPEAPFVFQVMNENMQVVENEDFNLLVKLIGLEIPNEVVLKVKNNSIKLRKKSKSEFEYTFKNIQEKKVFSLEAAGFSSIPYEITPIIKPVIMGYKVEVDYPSYTRLSDVTLESVNSLSVPQGTRLKWVFKTKNTSQINFSEKGKVIQLNEFAKNRFSTEKVVRKNASFILSVANKFMKNRDSIVFDISTSLDQNPSIFADSKADSLNENLLYFTGKISDDYGFSNFVFKYRKFKNDSIESRGKFTAKAVGFNSSYNQSQFYYLWDVDEVNLKLGESLEYYFEVWDNDRVNGAKSARTQLIKIKAPTKEELEKNQEEKGESIKDKLEKNIKDAEKLRQEIKKMTESILNKKNMDWQDKKKMKELLSKQKQLNEQNKDIRKKTQEKNKEEQRFSEPNEALIKKQEKLDKLMAELKNEELEKLMEKIEKMMEKIDKSKLQKSLEEMDKENLDMKKEMERTLEMFKQMEMDEKLDEFAEEIEKLAEKQEELAEKKEEENTSEEQEKLNEEFKKAEEKLDELKEKNEGLDKKKDLNEIEEEKEGAKDDMEESKESLDKNEKQGAQKSQKGAAKKMKSAAAKAKSMKSSSAESAEENMEDLRALLENLISLSFDQEEVLSDLKVTNTNDPNYVRLGQKQVKLKDDAKMIEDSLFALSKRIEQIAPIVNKEMNKINDGIKQSLRDIGERSTNRATQNQQLAMTSINNLALLLDEALKEMQKQASEEKKPGSGECNNPGGSKPKPGILPGIKKAKGEAGKALGKLKSKLGEKGKASEGEGKNSKELARMAAEQSMLRKALDEMSQELNKDGSGLGNELKKIEIEIEKVEEDIINDNITNQTITRQKEILTRLLKSEKAIREREFDEKRESSSVKTLRFSNPNEFLEYNRRKEMELEQLKTIPPSLIPYYKNRVNDYFNQSN